MSPRSTNLATLSALLLFPSSVCGLVVELRELLPPTDARVSGSGETISSYWQEQLGISDVVDSDCVTGLCRGTLTRDESLELDSRYGCTVPVLEDDDPGIDTECGVDYDLGGSYTIASVRLAFHPDSETSLLFYTDDDEDSARTWTGEAGTTELQEVPDVAGLTGEELSIFGNLGGGEYLGLLEAEIYVEVDEVPVTGVSATSRLSVSATATVDDESAAATLDGDDSATSAWTCSGASSCEIAFDLGDVESVDQIRIDFVEDSTTSGGTFNVYAAPENGEYSAVLVGATAGQRADSTGTGLQTFGGVRALARYIMIEAVPASGGSIVMSEVDIRVGESAAVRPVEEKPWLKSVGMTPLGSSTYRLNGAASYDERTASEGGCSNEGPFEGCHVYYIKDGEDTAESRWSCGPTVVSGSYSCETEFDLVYYRYLRQIQLSFHDGDQQHYEFSIEAEAKFGPSSVDEWVTVLPSVITELTTEPQTFDLRVHAKNIRLVPKFQRVDQFINVKEMTLLQRKDLNEDAQPILAMYSREDDDDVDGSLAKTTSHCQFILDQVGESIEMNFGSTVVSGVRMKFPKDRVFNFDIDLSYYDDDDTWVEATESFTSAGGRRQFETFTFSEPRTVSEFTIYATGGPEVDGRPDYPALKVGDFEVVGEPVVDSTRATMASTAIVEWGLVPDIYSDGKSEQEEIMTAICTAKGATYDGVDCVGDLNDSTFTVKLIAGNFYVDGPIYIKSGITLEGTYSNEGTSYGRLNLYNGPNIGSVEEDAIVVLDGVSGGGLGDLYVVSNVEFTGTEVPGTLGNLCVDVKNSDNVRLDDVSFYDCPSGGLRMVDTADVVAYVFDGENYANGNMLSFQRTQNFSLFGFWTIEGMRIEDSTDFSLTAFEDYSGRISPPTGGDQEAPVVIAGDSSGITFQAVEEITAGAEPRILLESTAPFTLDYAGIDDVFEDATSGECLIQVPEGTDDSILVQLNTEEPLTRSGNCYTL